MHSQKKKDDFWFILAVVGFAGIMSVGLLFYVGGKDFFKSCGTQSRLPKFFWARGQVPQPSQPIRQRIYVNAVYFVPKDKAQDAWPDWFVYAREALNKMKAFHRLQFGDKFDFDYSILPEAVMGEENAAFYDGMETSGGNPHAWRTVRAELNRRLGEVSASSSFAVRLAVYEGVGAMGGNDTVLVSSGYLRNADYRITAPSIFYHELGHVMGLEDEYDYQTGSPLTDDIMGWGRQRPIEQTYLSQASRNKILSEIK